MQIQVKYVNPPKKANGKYGNVKTAEGKTYFVAIAALGQFSPGASYDVTTEAQTWGSDAVEVITKVNSAQTNAASNAAQNAQVSAAQTGETAKPTPPRPANDNGMHIFVTGVVGRAMGSGKYGLPDVAPLAEAAKHAWNTQVAA